MCHHSECGCEQHASPAPAWHHPGSCCCGSGHTPRRFHTREEIVEQLQERLKQLRAEASGVEERIAELGKKG